jgi:pimeloyl-ACP methyl ester carboxylesterase
MTQTPQALAAAGLARAVGQTVELPSGTTAYWTYPATAERLGSIIFIHGYRGNHHGLEAIAGALPNFNVVIPDLPGFGKSSAFKGKHTVGAYEEWLRAFVAILNVDNAVVLGHSFGSIITAAAAASGLPNRLILVNPVSMFERTRKEKSLEQLTNWFYGVGSILPEGPANYLLSNPTMVRIMSEVLAKTKNKALRGWIHAQHAANFSDYAERRVAVEGYASSTSRNVASYARGIANEVLMIAGELDDITSVKDQIRTLHLFKNAHLEVIHHVGHLIHYETPAQAAALILPFASNHG